MLTIRCRISVGRKTRTRNYFVFGVDVCEMISQIRGMKKILYRAADDDIITDCGSFAEARETADTITWIYVGDDDIDMERIA